MYCSFIAAAEDAARRFRRVGEWFVVMFVFAGVVTVVMFIIIVGDAVAGLGGSCSGEGDAAISLATRSLARSATSWKSSGSGGTGGGGCSSCSRLVLFDVADDLGDFVAGGGRAGDAESSPPLVSAPLLLGGRAVAGTANGSMEDGRLRVGAKECIVA